MAREADAGRGPVARRAQENKQQENQPERPAGEVDRSGRRGSFIRESWAELKKVEWPGQNQVIQGTVVVLVACIIVGAYLWLNDQAWKYVVEKVLL
ncbi:MAG: preprotein translocase subunit SecE [Gaiellaceae bacterium]